MNSDWSNPFSPLGAERTPLVVPQDCTATVVQFDFAFKSIEIITLEHAAVAVAAGRFVWIDIDHGAVEPVRHLIEEVGLLPDSVVAELLSGDVATRLSRHPECILLTLNGCRLDEAGALSLEPVSIVMAEHFMLTVHAGPRAFLDMVQREYADDFQRFAQSPSFLIYELWDNLIDHYLATQKRLEHRVEALQADLFKDSDDSVFSQVAGIGATLLHFRSVLMPARGVLTELSTRRSLFISEATRAALGNMVGVLDHVLEDVLVDRDILSQSLNLHMSMTTHRTNRAMNKLTVISAVFLPLTFLCGIYGMNFDAIPELHWRYGYLLFWVLVAIVVIALGVVLRRMRLL